jgi:hypothetical protein
MNSTSITQISFLHPESARIVISNHFPTCFHDKDQREKVSRITRQDLLTLISEPIEADLFPDVEKGEVPVDSRGEGSFQHR